MNDNNENEDSNQATEPNKLVIESAGITPEQQTADSEATDKYSQYDPLVESKEHYEDALFSSDDELEKAITQGFSKIDSDTEAKENKKHETQTELSENTLDDQPPQKAEAIILTDFLTAHSREGKFKSGIHLFSKDGTQLPLLELKFLDDLYGRSDSSTAQIEPYPCKLPKAKCGQLPQGKKNFKAHIETATILFQYQFQKVKIAQGIYFGRSLPVREIDFEYKPLKLKSQKELGDLYSQYDIDNLYKTKGIKPYQLLLESNQELSKLIKCQLSAKKKTSLLESYTRNLLPIFHQLFITYGKRAVSARNTQHGEIAEFCKSIAKHIITLYKQLYMHLYQAKPYLYGPQRNKANALAYKLFDWLMFEQLLCITTQSPLPEASIKLSHKLFYALSLSEPLEIRKSRSSICSDDNTTIEQQFVHYQLLNVIDFHCISSRLHQAIIKLVRQCNIDSRVLAFNTVSPSSTSAPPTNFWIDIDRGNQLQPEVISTGINIDISHFLETINSHYKESIEKLGNQEDKNQAFDCLHPLVNSLHNWLNQVQVNHYSMFQPSKTSLFSGLDNCFNHSAHAYASNIKQTQAKPPEIELPEKPVASKTTILVAENNAALISLQFAESKAKINLNIGSPVIYQELNSENNSTTAHLGICQRISRNQAGLVDIELAKLSDQYTAVNITSMTPPNNKGMIYTSANKHFLIVHADEECWKGKTLDVEMHDQSMHVICIKNLLLDFGQIRIYELF